jgi:putative sterol carrier protein
VVVISNSGFPEQSHFSGLKETFRCYMHGNNAGLAGMICCGAGGLLRVPEYQGAFNWYLDAVKQAGREVVLQGKIQAETQATLDKPLMEDQKLFCEMTNAFWRLTGVKSSGEASDQQPAKITIPAGQTPLTPPASLNTVQDLVAGMAFSFNPTAAGDLNKVIQFSVSNETPGHYYLAITDGTCRAYIGKHPEAHVTITTPSEVWLGMSKGQINPGSAFITGQYQVTGEMEIFMRFGQLFSNRK